MNIVNVVSKKEQNIFLKFRRKIYKANPKFVDNNSIMIKQVFSKATAFVEEKEIFPLYVEDDGKILCEGIVVYAKKLSDYIQLCFFEAEENVFDAVKMLVDKAIEIGKSFNCEKLVIGLCGHVNYGLGFLCTNFDSKNSFSGSINPSYYIDYFKKFDLDEIMLNTYLFDEVNNHLDKYSAIIEKIEKNYTFKFFDKKKFDYFAKIYTDLNNKTFPNHRYYYERNYKEDIEMLKELFLFMKEESLIFAFKGDEPVGFIMWYPDFNELVKEGEAFGVKTFIRNLFLYKKIKRAKIMEFGVIDEYRNSGLAIALVNRAGEEMKKSGIEFGESSWILDENDNSNGVTASISKEMYKRYVVYEKTIK